MAPTDKVTDSEIQKQWSYWWELRRMEMDKELSEKLILAMFAAHIGPNAAGRVLSNLGYEESEIYWGCVDILSRYDSSLLRVYVAKIIIDLCDE